MLFAVVSLFGNTTGPITVQGITNPPVVLNVITNMRTVTSGGGSTQVVKDRVNHIDSSASSVTDFQISVSRPATYLLSNPLTTIDTNGLTFYTNAGVTFMLATTDYGTFVAQLNYVTNSAISNTNFIGFDNGTLGSNLQFSINARYTGKTIANWPYNPNLSDLGTNLIVWTYPGLLSCVGFTSGARPTTLIAPNVTLWNNHYFGDWTNAVTGIPTTATFTDTNGVRRTARYINAIAGPNDFAIGILESNLTSAVVPAYVLFVTVSNNITSWLGVQTFVAHKNTAHMDLANTVLYPATIFNGAPGMVLVNARTNIFGNEQGATSGDSGSPSFVCWGVTNIVIFATTQSGDFAGDPVFDPLYWGFLAANINTNILSIINLSGLPTF